MTASANNATPSTLADVLRQIVDAMSAMGDATAIQVGKQYLPHLGAGAPPRVLFVPEPKGKIGPPYDIGYAASVTHSCNVYVRGAESGDDIGRFDAAYALSDRIMSLVSTATTGKGGAESDFADDSPAGVDCYGADVAWSFTYRRDVPHDAARYRLAGATADAAPPPVPAYPQAVMANEPITLTVTTTPTETA